MKIVLGIGLILLTVIPAFAQTYSRTYDAPHHSYGWIGLLGLAGLAGLRRPKSVEQQRMETSGINVKSVKV
jgi:MYXO-CTERM domain-containing protein